MNRIKAILNFIDKTDKVVDIGCDSATLGILLAKIGQKSIACDISENVIKSTKEKIKNLKLENYIELVLSDGLSNININNINTAILSGMGAYTIINILKDVNSIEKIITISNNNNDILRKYMCEKGYYIYKEQIIKEYNKYYNLIVFKKGKKEYSEKDYFIGVNHIDKITKKEYLNFLYNKYNLIKEKSNNKNDLINKKIMYILETINEEF